MQVVLYMEARLYNNIIVSLLKLFPPNNEVQNNRQLNTIVFEAVTIRRGR